MYTSPTRQTSAPTQKRSRRSSLFRAAIFGTIAFVPGESLASAVSQFDGVVHVVNDTTGAFEAATQSSFVAIGEVDHVLASAADLSEASIALPAEPFIALTLSSEAVVVFVPLSEIVIDTATDTIEIFPSAPLTSVPEEWTRLPFGPAFDILTVPEEWTRLPKAPSSDSQSVPEEWTSLEFSTTVPEEWTRFLSPLVTVPEEWTRISPLTTVPEEWTRWSVPAHISLFAQADAILRVQN